MEQSSITRRDLLKTTAVGVVGMGLGMTMTSPTNSQEKEADDSIDDRLFLEFTAVEKLQRVVLLHVRIVRILVGLVAWIRHASLSTPTRK